MNKCILFLCGLLTISLASFSQYSVKGKILDSNTRQVLDFVNVSISKNGETIPLSGTSTDEQGNFELVNIKSGTYLLSVSFVGYDNAERSITITNKSIDLGKIYLSENNQQLSEIEVVGQGSTMRFELDKKVFSVDQNIASAGGSASEVLENIPSIEVDGEGNISLRNSESVEVWINGKPAGLTAENRAQVLQQMPAESIQEIEVITNPSAKYSPEGTSGIINLVMKKNRKAGYYGSLSAGLMYPWGGKLGGMGGLNINYSKGIVDAYLNVGYRQMNANGSSLSDRYNYGTDTTRLYQTGISDRGMHGLFTRAGIDVRITDKSTIGLSGFGIIGDRSKEYSNVEYKLSDGLTDDANILRYYERSETVTGKRPSYSFTADYRADFTQAQNLMISASYSAHQRGSDNTYIQNNLQSGTAVLESQQHQWSNNNNSNWDFKADYTNKFTQNSRLEAGAQVTLQNRYSFSNAEDANKNPIPAYYNKFDYKEQLYAAYITYGNRFWECLSAQIGLRGEYLTRESYTNDVSNNLKPYFKLFPSAYISYAMPHNNELQLNYTRRVDRPRGRQINPFRDFADSTNISYGNGNLTPQFSSALELNYLKNWERHTLSAGIFYRFTDDVIQNVRYVNVDNVMENTYINISKSRNVGVELVAKNRLFGDFLQLTTSINGYYSQMDSANYTFNNAATVHIPEQNSWSWDARINAMMMFSKTFSGQISARYSSPRLIAQGSTTHNYAVDLGLRKSFFNRTLSLNFMVRDIFDSRSRSSKRWGDNFYQYSINRFMGRSLGLMVSYNFGNMKPKKQEQSGTEQDSSSFNENSFE